MAMYVYLGRGARAARPVEDYAEASRLCREYIERHGYGASEWDGGRLTCLNGGPVGHVSYNGRVWAGEPGDWRPGDQPLYQP